MWGWISAHHTVGWDTGGGLDITWHHTKASPGATEADVRPAGVTVTMVNYRRNESCWLAILKYVDEISCGSLSFNFRAEQ